MKSLTQLLSPFKKMAINITLRVFGKCRNKQDNNKTYIIYYIKCTQRHIVYYKILANARDSVCVKLTNQK